MSAEDPAPESTPSSTTTTATTTAATVPADSVASAPDASIPPSDLSALSADTSSASASASLPPSSGSSGPHPLHSAWTLYFSKPSERGGWQSNLKQVATVGTAEEFWRLFNAVRAPSALALKQDLHLFRAGIAPEWEDRQNLDGGKWTVTFAKGGRVDDAWLSTLLAVIGEAFSDGDEVNGIVIAPRAKELRLSLWTRTAKDEATQRRIGTEWRALMGDAAQSRLEYQSHSDAMSAGTNYSYRQAAYVL